MCVSLVEVRSTQKHSREHAEPGTCVLRAAQRINCVRLPSICIMRPNDVVSQRIASHGDESDGESERLPKEGQGTNGSARDLLQ